MNRAATRYAIGLVRSHPGLLLRFAATSVGRSAVVMGSVLLIQRFLAAVLENKAAPAAAGSGEIMLWGIGLLLIISYVAASVLAYDTQVGRQRIVKVAELALMERLVRHLLTLSVRYFDRTSHGDLLHAIRKDVTDLRAVLMAYAMIVMEGTTAVGLVTAAVWISPRLTFWALLVIPAATLPLVMIARRTQARSFAERQSGYVVFDMILQLLRGIRIIKAYQAEEQETHTTIEQARRYLDAQIGLVQVRELSNVLLESLAGLSIAAVIIIGGIQVMHGGLGWPQLLAFLIAVRSLHGPLDHINNNLMEIQQHAAAADRISQLLAERPEVDEARAATPLRSPPTRVAFDNVSFSYGDGLALRNVSFEIRTGETIGIAGPSGSGKTTLLGVVARFYDPTSGVVRFDDHDLRTLRLQDVYRQIAIVTQEPFLFAASVRENIRCGRPAASDADVEAAARIAEIHDEIIAMPLGYETPLGPAGRVLSGGQAQRVNIARAVLKNAPFLLLDEATSSLDSIAEAKVQLAIDRLMHGRTSLIVAHRLSTLRHADRILVLDHGHMVAFGSHDALVCDCALYRRMWETQLLGETTPQRVDAPAEQRGGFSADAGDD